MAVIKHRCAFLKIEISNFQFFQIIMHVIYSYERHSLNIYFRHGKASLFTFDDDRPIHNAMENNLVKKAYNG